MSIAFIWPSGIISPGKQIAVPADTGTCTSRYTGLSVLPAIKNRGCRYLNAFRLGRKVIFPVLAVALRAF